MSSSEEQKEEYEDEGEVVEVKWDSEDEFNFFENARKFFEEKEFKKSCQNLAVLEQFHRNRQYHIEKGEYDHLKYKIFRGFLTDQLKPDVELFSLVREHSWLKDDDTGSRYFDKLFSEGFSASDLPEMKNKAIDILRAYYDPLIKVFCKESEEKVRRFVFELFDAKSNSSNFEHLPLIEEETKTMFENDLLKTVMMVYEAQQEFFNGLEDDSFVTQEDASGGMKYFGMVENDQKVGYGLLYKEFSTRSFLKKKVFLRPCYYGKFAVQEDDEEEREEGAVLIRDGDECKEYSLKDGRLVYFGSFRDGKREGKGKEFRYVPKHDDSLVIFEGRFSDGRRHGRGECIDPETGEVRTGRWRNGIFDKNSELGSGYRGLPVIKYADIRTQLTDSNRLGGGSYGQVFCVNSSSIPGLKTTKGHEKVAVKVIKTKERYEKMFIFRTIRKGINLQSMVDSEHKLKIFGVIQGLDTVGYIMEFCEEDTVGHLLVREIEEAKLTFDEKIQILVKTAIGVRSFHDKSIMLRDLKWSHVMMKKNKEIKISCIGGLLEDESSWRMEERIDDDRHIGTPGFRPPEVINGNKWSPKAESFAFGIMIFSLIGGFPNPYSTQRSCGKCRRSMDEMIRNNQIEKCIAECDLRPLVSSLKGYPQKLIELMRRCWDVDPHKRPNFEEIEKELKFLTEEELGKKSRENEELKKEVRVLRRYLEKKGLLKDFELQREKLEEEEEEEEEDEGEVIEKS